MQLVELEQSALTKGGEGKEGSVQRKKGGMPPDRTKEGRCRQKVEFSFEENWKGGTLLPYRQGGGGGIKGAEGILVSLVVRDCARQNVFRKEFQTVKRVGATNLPSEIREERRA